MSISESKQRANRNLNAHKSIGFFGEETNTSKTFDKNVNQKASRSLFNENIDSFQTPLLDDSDNCEKGLSAHKSK